VLDPCCGTGAYLLEVARCIAEELRREGDADVIGIELLKAFEERVMGFEILTAPFAIAQLQLYILLAELGVEPPAGHRLAISLRLLLGSLKSPVVLSHPGQVALRYWWRRPTARCRVRPP
jgi:hypothetical protein